MSCNQGLLRRSPSSLTPLPSVHLGPPEVGRPGMCSASNRIGRRTPRGPSREILPGRGVHCLVLWRSDLLAAWLGAVLLLVPTAGLAQDDDDSAAPAPASAAALAPVRVDPLPPPPDPAITWAHARQFTLPAWSARTEAAIARTEAARAYFSGTLALEVAWPVLARGPLHSQAWLSATLMALEGRESSRLRERSESPPDFGDPPRSDHWRAARAAALDAEDLADSQQRRLLLGLRATAIDHSDLAGAGYAAERARLGEVLAALEERWPRTDPGAARDALALDLAAVQSSILALDDQARSTRRWATVPGAAPPSPAADIEALAGDGAAAASERLLRLRPILDPPARHAVDVALVAWMQDTLWPAAEAELAAAKELEAAAPAAPQPSRWRLQADIFKQSELVAVRAATVAALGSSDDPVSVLRRRIAEAERAAAVHRLGACRVFFERSLQASPRSVSEVQADAAGERAESARREADKASRAARDVQSRKIAVVLEEVATVEAEAKTSWDALHAREAALSLEVGAWQVHLKALSDEITAIRELPPGLGGQRRSRSATVWADLHGQLTLLRRAAVSAGADSSAARAQVEDVGQAVAESRGAIVLARAFGLSLPETEGRANLIKALDQWEAALESRLDAADQATELARQHRETVLVLLRDGKLLRDRVRRDVPRAALDKDREVLFEDLSFEVRLAIPNLAVLVRDRLETLSGLPRLVRHLDQLWAILVGSFWLLLASLAWLVGRGRVGRLVALIVARLEDRGTQLFARSFESLRDPLTQVGKAGVDLIAVVLLLGPVNERAPEIALLLVLYRLVAIYRLFDGLFRLAVTAQDESRPALLSIPREAWTLAVRATRLLLLLLILGSFVQYLCRELLRADALGLVLGSVFWGAFFVLSLVLLYQAEPHLRAAVAGAPESALQSWLVTAPKNPFVSRAPRGLLSLLLMIGVRSWQILQGAVHEGSTLGSMLNVLNRRWLTQRREADGDKHSPISPAIARRIESADAREEIATLYPSLDAAFDTAVQGWRDDAARGLILLVGDRGQGKEVWAHKALDRLEGTTELPTLRARLSLRLIKPGHLFGYLAREWGLGQISSAEDFERAIKSLPPTCFLVEEIEFAFLRRVGGFAALRAFFRVVTATSSTHLWLLTVHGPAWRLLERVGTVANPNSFRAVLEIPRLGGSELGQYLGMRTAAAGFRPDFGALSSSTPAGQPAAELERTAEAFFRLLAEAAGGNPGIALPLWTASLCPGGDEGAQDSEEAPRLLVRLPEFIINPDLPPLSDEALLTLAAVRVHGFLNVAEIIEATNMEPDLVGTTAQVLENLTLLERVDNRLRIGMVHLPAITRLLRRRHFIYGKDQG